MYNKNLIHKYHLLINNHNNNNILLDKIKQLIIYQIMLINIKIHNN
jgi:hypothetical protein